MGKWTNRVTFIHLEDKWSVSIHINNLQLNEGTDVGTWVIPPDIWICIYHVQGLLTQPTQMPTLPPATYCTTALPVECPKLQPGPESDYFPTSYHGGYSGKQGMDAWMCHLN